MNTESPKTFGEFFAGIGLMRLGLELCYPLALACLASLSHAVPVPQCEMRAAALRLENGAAFVLAIQPNRNDK